MSGVFVSPTQSSTLLKHSSCVHYVHIQFTKIVKFSSLEKKTMLMEVFCSPHKYLCNLLTVAIYDC